MKTLYSLLLQSGLTLFFCVLTSSFLLAQAGSDCPCEKELGDVAQKIKAAKSYKQQIKGKKVQAMRDWQASIAFLKDRRPTQFPEHLIDTATLAALRHQPTAALEGIYHLGSDELALIKVEENTWYGVMVASTSERWQAGVVRLRMRKEATATAPSTTNRSAWATKPALLSKNPEGTYCVMKA
ncbi:MAG: hypothetical protein AAGG75_21055 [Bacteroidota bacterium]